LFYTLNAVTDWNSLTPRFNTCVAPPGWEAAMPGAYGTWHGTSPATGYRSSLLVVVARDLPQHFPLWASRLLIPIALSIALSLCSSQLNQHVYSYCGHVGNIFVQTLLFIGLSPRNVRTAKNSNYPGSVTWGIVAQTSHHFSGNKPLRSTSRLVSVGLA
jgi:hypothetical protein